MQLKQILDSIEIPKTSQPKKESHVFLNEKQKETLILYGGLTKVCEWFFGTLENYYQKKKREQDEKG